MLAGHGRARPRRAPDHLRHRHERGPARGRRLRQGLAGGARDEGRRPRPRRAAGHPRRGRAGRRPDGRAARPPRRRARARGPVHAAHRGRPAHRSRRLRHEGRARGDDVRAARTSPTQDQVRVRFVCVPDEESEDVSRRSTDVLVKERAERRLRAHRRAHRPAHRHPGQGRARGAPADLGHGRPRLDPVAGRQRDPQGARRLPAHRDAALQPRVLRPLRPPVDQPRAHHRRRCVQQGPRRLHDRRRHPLPAQPGPRRHHDPDPRHRGPRDHQVLHARAGHRLAPQPLRAGPARRGRALDRGRRAVDRARRRLRRDLVPGGGHPRRRVRPRRRRPSRAPRVGVDLVAGAVSPGAGRFREPPAGLARAPGAALAARRRRRAA